eukprot:366268-Chlamydomonas_euryale.AAC.17
MCIVDVDLDSDAGARASWMLIWTATQGHVHRGRVHGSVCGGGGGGGQTNIGGCDGSRDLRNTIENRWKVCQAFCTAVLSDRPASFPATHPHAHTFPNPLKAALPVKSLLMPRGQDTACSATHGLCASHLQEVAVAVVAAVAAVVAATADAAVAVVAAVVPVAAVAATAVVVGLTHALMGDTPSEAGSREQRSGGRHAQ